MREFKAPEPIKNDKISIFLAGTIDMGNSDDWQSLIVRELSNYDVYIYNPRCNNWDPSWEQSINNPQFKEQVLWELDALEKADFIIFNFLPDSKSPITLFELGKHYRDNIIVCCPDKFYRSGNIHIVCEREQINLVKSQDELLTFIKEILKNLKNEKVRNKI